ncbi:MAG: hypothetical protein QOJ88_1116 [Pyrinomonadaceae bacterium]|jgi:hypothetical protein|nr:hypothetical protein [Pyrinomonadaceae bacterium]MDQ1729631.1 hypothetical protein [Pyrinomonadaceae bacterium]
MKNPKNIEVQQVLDQLFSDELIPFALSVGKITDDSDGYTIHFHDSRISTAKVVTIQGTSFSETCKAAVLHRVGQMSGPLSGSIKKISIDA